MTSKADRAARWRPGDRGTRTLIAGLLLSLGLFGLWEVLDAVLGGRDSIDLLRLLRGAASALIVAAVVLLLTLRSRRRQERRQVLARQHLESLMHSSPEAIVTTDLRGRFTYVSLAACELVDRTEEDLLRRRASEIYAEGEVEATRLARALLRQGEVRNRAVSIRRGDGATVPVTLTVSMLEDRSGRPVGTLGIARPATPSADDRSREEAERLAAVQDLSQAVANEVRNPLAGIRGAVQVLRGSGDRPPRECAVMGEVLGQITRIEEMVRDLLEFAQPRAASPRPERVADLVERALAHIRYAPAMAGVRVEVDIAPDLEALADASLFQRALLVVLENAAHAVAGRGTVRVDAIRDDGSVIIRVHDSGPGLDETRRDEVFRPFTTTKHKGTGLGLAIAQRTLEAHGGTITYERPASGGTRFLLAVPGVPGTVAPARERIAADPRQEAVARPSPSPR